MGSLSLEIMPWYMSAHFKEGIWVLECLSSKHEALSSNTSTAKKKKKKSERVFEWNFLKHHDPILGLPQFHHRIQTRVKEAPWCVTCITGRWTPGNSGCLCLSPSLHLRTLRVQLKDQPVTQATSTCGKSIRA
jgi:hypothetical protein